MKPVVEVPLWLAVPIYVMYAAVWIAVMVLIVAIVAASVIGYGIVAAIRRRQA